MNTVRHGIAESYPVESKVLLLLLFVTAICLGVGLIAPILTLEKFYLIENTFSIVSGLGQLLQEKKIFLFIVIVLFSVILPVLKLAVLFRLLYSQHARHETMHRYLHLMHQYGKWSMLDVFVVALLVVGLCC